MGRRVSQKAAGLGITQVSVEHSQNVSITISGRLALELFAPPYPRPLPNKSKEIDLLKAAYAQIPFVGRQSLLEDFESWCFETRPVSLRTLIGQGGAGKTRFAYEFYARMKAQPDWDVYFARFLNNDARGIDVYSQIPMTNALIVVDYASDYSRPLKHLLRSLTDSAPEGRQIRILLLARTASWEQGWLSGLASGRTGEDVDRYFEPRDPMRLPQFSTEERHAIFQQTVELAAKLTGKPIPPLPMVEAFSRVDVAERLSDPLTLMMAALVALHSDTVLALSLSRTDLAFEVAEKLVADRMKGAVDEHSDLFLHLAAYATLVGGLNMDEALRALRDESDETNLGSVADPKAFLNTLQAWMPGEKTKTWIGPIEPDIVGEAFVLGRGQRQQLYGAETTVLRAAHHRPTSSIATIIRIAQDFSFATAESRLEPLSWLNKLVERGEADHDLGLLFEISGAMPRSSLALQDIRVHVSTVICTRLKLLFKKSSGTHRLELQRLLANSLKDLSGRQGDNGQHEAALHTAQESVSLFEDLVARNRDFFLPEFAISLNDLANRERDLGLAEAALGTAQRATTHFRELVTRSRGAFLPLLAMSLTNMAAMQSDVGDRDAALTAAEEAVSLRRELLTINREAFLPRLAGSLSNLSSAQATLGQREMALATAQEAAEVYREVAAHNPDAFLTSLSVSLNNLAGAYRASGQLQAALSTAREAAGLRRALIGRNREAFQPWLAMTLTNLAEIESTMGFHTEALASAQEAVDLYRELVVPYRDAYLANFATSLATLSNAQVAAGQIEAALASAQEAAELRGELVLRNRKAFLPDLANSLNNLANIQKSIGRLQAAIEMAQKAVDLRRELVASNRAAFLPDLGSSLHNLASMQAGVGRNEDALVTAEESVRLHRELAASNRVAFLSGLGGSLTNLANRQAALGQRENALHTSQESMTIYRELVTRNPGAYAQEFARTSGSFADALTKLDRAAEAVPVLAEAIRTILPSVKRAPPAYLDICINLLRAYISTAEIARAQHDNLLVEELVGVIKPYLRRKEN